MLFWETEGEHTGRKNLEAEFSALNWGNGKCYSPVIFLTPIYYTISSCFPAQLMLAFMFLLNNFYDTVGQKIRSPFLSSSQVQARHSAGQNHKFSEDSVSQKLHFPSAYWLEKCHLFSHVHIFSSFSNNQIPEIHMPRFCSWTLKVSWTLIFWCLFDTIVSQATLFLDITE